MDEITVPDDIVEKPLGRPRAQVLASWLRQEKGIILQMGWRSLMGKRPAEIADKLGLDVAEVRRAAGPGVEVEG